MALLGINQQVSTGQDDRHLDSLRDSFFDMCRRLGTPDDGGRSITYNVRPEDGDISIRRSLPERYDSFHVEQMTLLKNAQGSDDISVYGHYQGGPSDRLILGSFASAYNDMYVSSSDIFKYKVGIGNKESVSRNYHFPLTDDEIRDSVIQLVRSRERGLYIVDVSDEKRDGDIRLIPNQADSVLPVKLLRYSPVQGEESVTAMCKSLRDNSLVSVLLDNGDSFYKQVYDTSSDSFKHRLCWQALQSGLDLVISGLVGQRGRDLDEKAFGDAVTMFLEDRKVGRDIDCSHFFRELKNVVLGRCIELQLDYTKMPESLKDPMYENEFVQECPYLVGTNEHEILDEAYNMGSKARINIKEPESPSNGYIGGEVLFNRLKPLINAPMMEFGKPTSIAFKDYKDCTNVYVLVGGNEKAVSFEGLNVRDRRSILQNIHESYLFRMIRQNSRDSRESRKSGIKM